MSSNKRESAVFHRLKDRIARPEDRFQRVENGLLDGWPDVNYCMSRQEGWIEIKAPIAPVRPTTPLFGSNHPVSVEQCNWLLAQSRAGGLGWLFIATEGLLLLIKGADVGRMGIKVNKLTLHELERMSRWKMHLPNLDPMRWLDLRECLTTPA